VKIPAYTVDRNLLVCSSAYQYDKVRSGEITQEEAAQSLKNLGAGRASGIVVAGDRGDYAAIAGRSSVSELTHDDGYGFWDQTKDVAQGAWNYVEGLYDRVRSGEITQEQAAEELKLIGKGRVGASIAAGNQGDLVFMSGNSVGEAIRDHLGQADSPLEENEYKTVKLGGKNYKISEADAFEGFTNDGGTPTLKQDTNDFIDDAPTLKDGDSNKQTIAGVKQDFVPPHMRFK